MNSKNMALVKNKNIVLIIISLILIMSFILLTFNLKSPALIQINNFVNNLMVKIQINFIIIISKVLSYLFETTIVVILSLIFSVYLYLKGRRKESIVFSIAVVLSTLTVYFFKIMFSIARPSNALVLENDFSFPSGHSSIVVIIFGFFACFYCKKFTKNKIMIILISIFSILIVSFSRLYLNVHWFSDVIGGLIIGSFWLLMSLIFFNKKKVGYYDS